MEIEKSVAVNGYQYISFTAMYSEKFTLVAQGTLLRCAVRSEGNNDTKVPFTHFTREQVKAILPYLQAFVETGTFDVEKEY